MGVTLYHNNWGTLVFVRWLVLFRWSWKTGRTVVDKSYYMHCTGTAKPQDENVCHSMVVVKIANFVLNPLWLIILSDMSRIQLWKRALLVAQTVRSRRKCAFPSQSVCFVYTRCHWLESLEGWGAVFKAFGWFGKETEEDLHPIL